jgi:hypothetical protein
LFKQTKEILMTTSVNPPKRPRRQFGLKGGPRDPWRMISIATFWAEFDQPIEHLEDPPATFLSDARRLINICLIRELPFQVPEAGLSEALFPLWILERMYPDMV